MNLDLNKPAQLGLIAVLLAGALFFSIQNLSETTSSESVVSDKAEEEIIEEKSAEYEKAKPLTDPKGYINTDNVSIEENIGDKVILLDMWTYSCINCQRTLPHLREWHRKYEDDGLLIIGNHAPEFDFEKDRSNVEEAVERFNITYPVVMDNNYGTWNAYNNRYWPQKYLIGVDGFIRYEHIGEGAYDQTEQKIVELLEERKERLGIESRVDEDGVKELADREHDTTDINPRKIETPEIYLGAWRNGRLGSGPQNVVGELNFTAPEELKKDYFYLDGKWGIKRKHAETSEPGASIEINYSAKNVNIVLDGENATLKVYQNGEPITKNSGESVESSELTVDSEQLYRIVENDKYGRNRLKIELVDGQLEAYTFTFG